MDFPPSSFLMLFVLSFYQRAELSYSYTLPRVHNGYYSYRMVHVTIISFLCISLATLEQRKNMISKFSDLLKERVEVLAKVLTRCASILHTYIHTYYSFLINVNLEESYFPLNISFINIFI